MPGVGGWRGAQEKSKDNELAQPMSKYYHYHSLILTWIDVVGAVTVMVDKLDEALEGLEKGAQPLSIPPKDVAVDDCAYLLASTDVPIFKSL
jgi:hypothetical protein